MRVIHKKRVRRRRWTAKEFYQMVEMNFFLDQRVELIEGEVILMPAQKNRHAIGIALTDDALRKAFGPNYWVRVQMTLDLSPYSVVDPDIAVIPGTPRQNNSLSNPTSSLLVVEVSETTLRYDQNRKCSLYARAGIADYWILNLVDHQLEIHRSPVPDPRRPLGFDYNDVSIFRKGDHVSPLVLPRGKIAVDDLLP